MNKPIQRKSIQTSVDFVTRNKLQISSLQKQICRNRFGWKQPTLNLKPVDEILRADIYEHVAAEILGYTL